MRENTNKKWLKKSFILLLIFISSACGMITPPEDNADQNVNENATRVAAVGDSITAEYMSDSGYPERLNELLGADYTVENFGESNYAAQSSSDFPYEATSSHEESLAFEPEIVIIMLGTNDTKANNWQGPDQFKTEYTNLVDSYLELDSVSRVILASPATVFLENVPRGSIEADTIDSVRTVIKEVADEYELEFVDITEQTANHAEWFFDGIHPTPEGAEELAQIFYEQINK